MRTKSALTSLVFLLVVLLFAGRAQTQTPPRISETDRIRLAEAFRVGETLGDRIWKNWKLAPFAVLLITPENEFLIRHPKPPTDFTLSYHDTLLRSDIYIRKRTLSPGFLATFPFNGVPTIVIGQAENTAKKTSTPWVATVLHEHFHQLQYSQPRYYADVNGLNLSRGDQTGMWMLNYAFPYTDSDVEQQFTILTRLLAKAIRTERGGDLNASLAAYLEARRKLQAMLSPDDYRYFSFQVWQEGLARYTEYRVADLAARRYRPRKEFRALADYRPFSEVADEILQTTLKELETLRLDDYGRVAFYSVGAGEGLLLDRVNPQWTGRYFKDRFYVDKYFARAR